ncbi:helix-turn-helix transcriptional regulator [Martelella mediterranea]|uniref:AraC family transcriptional regulator n=1 Tax=Martelella mediterranea TaxID=293089 RepID=UPI001E551A86|nr:helix-turn-helix transcriptional regulator [Martelella mediterranea]MCD1636429.1 helix-turn-helix transcriptional regulator [Martelella mediterranea]
MTEDITGPEDIIALGRRYADGSHLEEHRHERSQLLYGLTGTAIVTTQSGLWMMPPDAALWIPDETPHEVTMVGEVNMRSLYLKPALLPQMPRHCVVLEVGTLLRALLDALAETNGTGDNRRRLMSALVLLEIASQPIVPLTLPLPPAGPLRNHCMAFSAAPNVHAKLDDWCAALNMSRRNFTRVFRAGTGLSFVEWRSRACVLAAISRLSAGHQVTRIAFDLGYDSSASFAVMFRRATGGVPSRYRQKQ